MIYNGIPTIGFHGKLHVVTTHLVMSRVFKKMTTIKQPNFVEVNTSMQKMLFFRILIPVQILLDFVYFFYGLSEK